LLHRFPTKINWYNLSKNPSAIYLLKKNNHLNCLLLFIYNHYVIIITFSLYFRYFYLLVINYLLLNL
jgi:hypothetical protein